METIKSVLGYGTKADEGQEPVSGHQGTGTAGEPYDAGNSEDTSLGGKAPQVTDATSTSTPTGSTTRPDIPTPKPSEQFPTAAETGTSDATASSAKPFESSTADDFSPSATTGASSSAIPPSTSAVDEPSTTAPTSTGPVGETSIPESSADQPKKTGGIGSSGWFSTALPFVGNKNKGVAEGESAASELPAATTSNKSTTDSNPLGSTSTNSNPLSSSTTENNPIESSTTADAPKTVEDSSTLPPNHLPTDVPEGVSSDLAPPQIPAAQEAVSPKSEPTSNPLSSALPSSSDTTTSSALPSTSTSDTPAASELPGSKAPPHTSRFAEETADADSDSPHHRNNPSAIPTAGGKPLGVAAVEERKHDGLPAEPGPNLPENVIGNPDLGGVAKPEKEKESVTSGSSSTAKDGHGTPEKEGKHKHHLLQKIKDKIKH